MSKFDKKKNNSGLLTGIIIGIVVSSILFLTIYLVFLRTDANTPTENPQGTTDMHDAIATQPESGFRMGTLNDQGGDIAVCLTLYDVPQDAGWTDTERNLFLTLQEQAFTMLERLAEDSRYTSILN